MYLADIGDGTITLHNDITGDINGRRLVHLKEVFACLLLCLQDRGMDHLDTWVLPDDYTGIGFAEHFGFQSTGFDKVILLPTGETLQMSEMRISF